MFRQKPTRSPQIAWIGFALTWTAGCVDAIGYLTLGEIYVANMSGNTVAIAIHFSQHNWLQAWRHACPLLAFFPGLVAGNALTELCKQRRVRAPLAAPLFVEAGGLALFLLIAQHAISVGGIMPSGSQLIYALLVSLLAFSMGLQNGALRRIRGLRDVHTYVTGTLVAAADGCTKYLFWIKRRLRKTHRTRVRHLLLYSPRQRSLRSALLAALLWVSYVAGATSGALAQSRHGIGFLLLAIAVLLLIAVADTIKPLHRCMVSKLGRQPK
jgi:uncharacterized membrane protein YoaK (UPF0700 family)